MPRNILKRGQLKMLESVAVLIVFFFLLGFGLQFYARIAERDFQNQMEKFAEQDAIALSLAVVHMAELRCLLKNTDQGSCIDLYKAKAWEELHRNGAVPNPALVDILGFSSVVLTYSYKAGSPSLPSNMVLYNFTPPGNQINSAPTLVPVVILDPITKNKAFGILEITIYERAE